MTRAGLAVLGSIAALTMSVPPAAHALASSDSGHHAASSRAPKAHLHDYVTDSLKVGKTVAQADRYAFDLNKDKTPDNALGKALIGFSSSDVDVDTALASSMTSGQVVMLDSLRTSSLTHSRAASWQVFSGKPKAHPVLTGGGKFGVDPAAPTGSKLAGAIKHGRFLGGPGTIPLRLALVSGQPAVQLRLVDARIQARCQISGCSKGKLGGAITETQLDSKLFPAFAAELQAIVDASCSAASPDTCSPEAHNILELFDTNDDFVISVDEVRSNNVIQSTFAPDLDLFKANGKPGHDGVDDSISLGLGFTTKSARFKQP